MMVMSGRMAQENAIELLKIMNPPSITYYEVHSITEEEAKRYSVWAIISGDNFCVVKCSARKEIR